MTQTNAACWSLPLKKHLTVNVKVIRIVEVLTMSFCDNMCYMEPDCVSINVHKQVSGHGGYKSELNNVTHERHEHDLEKKDDYFYHAAEVGVASLANTNFK